MRNHRTGKAVNRTPDSRCGRFARVTLAMVLLTAACERKETPSFEVVEDPTIDVPTIRETVPDKTAPDLSVGMLAREAAAAIDARLSGLRRRELTMELEGGQVVVTAFIDSSGVRLVRERPADPAAGGPNARYYFQDDDLLYYESTAHLRGEESTARRSDGNPDGRPLLRTVIGFDGHRGALERTRTLDGAPARMDGNVVDSVLTRADRILEALARGSPPK